MLREATVVHVSVFGSYLQLQLHECLSTARGGWWKGVKSFIQSSRPTKRETRLHGSARIAWLLSTISTFRSRRNTKVEFRCKNISQKQTNWGFWWLWLFRKTKKMTMWCIISCVKIQEFSHTLMTICVIKNHTNQCKLSGLKDNYANGIHVNVT